MKNLRNTLEAGLAGAVLTLVSGLVPSTPGNLVGASWYGWPLTWVRKLVLAPQYNPWVVDWYGLIADFIFWFAVSWIIGYIICVLSSKTTGSKSKTKK
jgi:hypothetical protein